MFRDLLKETQTVNEQEPQHIGASIASALTGLLSRALQAKQSNVRITGEPVYALLDKFNVPGYTIPVAVDGESEGYKMVMFFGNEAVETYLVKPTGETTSLEELL